MPDSLTKAQKADRFKNRRRMAWLSFWFLFGGGAILISLGMSSDALSGRIAAMATVISMVFGAAVAVVLGYVGAASYEHARIEETL